MNVVALYCDGGVVAHNPSTVGGTWAYCGVDGDGRRVTEASGFLACTPHHSEYTNNQTEFIAALRALRSVHQGWDGVLYSDSLVTLNRLSRLRSMMNARNHVDPAIDGLPPSWVNGALTVLAGLGPFTMTLLAGHPSSEELRAGHKLTSGGLPVSEHNVWCDLACGDRARDRVAEHRWSLLDGPVEQVVTVSNEQASGPQEPLQRATRPVVVGGSLIGDPPPLCPTCGVVVCDCPKARSMNP